MPIDNFDFVDSRASDTKDNVPKADDAIKIYEEIYPYMPGIVAGAKAIGNAVEKILPALQLNPVEHTGIGSREMILIAEQFFPQPRPLKEAETTLLTNLTKEIGNKELAAEMERIKEEGKAWGASPEKIAGRGKERADQYAAAECVAEMIVKGDMEGLMKMMSRRDGNPVDMKLVAHLLKEAGLNIVAEVDRQGHLLISHPGDDCAVMIDSNGKADLVGIKGRQYDFNAVFVNANPEQELKAILGRAFFKDARPTFEFPSRRGWNNRIYDLNFGAESKNH